MSAPHGPQNPSRGGRGGRSRNSSLARNVGESGLKATGQRGGRQPNGKATPTGAAGAGTTKTTPVTRGSRGRINKSGAVTTAGQLRNGVRKPPPLSQEYTGISEKPSWRDPRAVTAAVYKDRMHELWSSLKKGREQERKNAIRDGVLADPDRPTSLKNAITPVGTCQDMCPEFERVERIVQQMVDGAEKAVAPPGQPRFPCEEYMVKRFRRSAAGYDEQLPSDIRPPDVLERTLDYLIDEVVGKQPLAQIHKFVWDRTRSIRNDFSIQQVTKEKDVKIAIRCFERIARFHILSLHQLSHPHRDNGEFDHHQEREQLNNTLLSLMYYYDDNRKIISSRNEPEFRAYCIIFEVQAQRPDLEDRMQSWDLRLLKDPRVETAKQLHDSVINSSDDQGPLRPRTNFSIAQGIFNRFWDLVGSNATTYLMACTAEIYFNYARSFALNTIWKAYKRGRDVRLDDWVIDDVKRFLGFDDEDQAIQFCEEHGFTIGETNGELYLDVNSVSGKSLIDHNPRRKQLFSKLVEGKRKGLTLPAIVDGLSYRRATALGMLESGADHLAENTQEDALFVSESSSEEKEDMKKGEEEKRGESNLRGTEAANPSGVQTGNPVMNPFARPNTFVGSQSSTSTFGKPSTFVPAQSPTPSFVQPAASANSGRPDVPFGTLPSTSAPENKAPSSVNSAPPTSAFNITSSGHGPFNWHVLPAVVPPGPNKVEKPSIFNFGTPSTAPPTGTPTSVFGTPSAAPPTKAPTSVFGTPSAAPPANPSASVFSTPSVAPPTGSWNWPVTSSGTEPATMQLENKSPFPVSTNPFAFKTHVSESSANTKPPSSGFATPPTLTSKVPETAVQSESKTQTSVLGVAPKSVFESASKTAAMESKPFSFVHSLDSNSTSNEPRPPPPPPSLTPFNPPAPSAFQSSSTSNFTKTGTTNPGNGPEKPSSGPAIQEQAPPIFNFPSQGPTPQTGLSHQQWSLPAGAQPLFSLLKPNETPDSTSKTRTTTEDTTTSMPSSSTTPFKFSLSKPDYQATAPIANEKAKSQITSPQSRPFNFDPSAAVPPMTTTISSVKPSFPSILSSHASSAQGRYSVGKSVLEQTKTGLQAADLRSKAIDKLAHDFVSENDGVLQQFLEYILSPMIKKSIKKVNVEKERAKVAEARHFLLGQKYFRKWKQIVWKRYLSRNAKERRKNFRQSMQESARSSQNSSRAGSEIPGFGSSLLKSVMAPPEKPASSTLNAPSLTDVLSKHDEKERKRLHNLGVGTNTSAPTITSGSRLIKYAHKRSRTVEHTGHLSSSGAVSKLQRSYSPADSTNSDKSQSLLSEALRLKARRLAPPDLSTDTTRTDYFRLKAMGIDPDTPVIPVTRKRRASDQVDMTDTKTRRPTPPTSSLPRSSSAYPNGAIASATSLTNGVPSTAPNTNSRPLADDDDEALFAQVHQLKEALSESITWFREETEKSTLSRSVSRSKQTSPDGETEKERRLREFQWTPSRTEMRLRATGGHGLLPKNWAPSNGGEIGRTSRGVSVSNDEFETPTRDRGSKPMGFAAINSGASGSKDGMKAVTKGKGKEKEVVSMGSGATPDDAIEL